MKTVDELIKQIKNYMPSHHSDNPVTDALIESVALAMHDELVVLQQELDSLTVKVACIPGNDYDD
jgi:hypothetical protein